MDASEFARISDACLAKVSKWLESFDSDDLDYTTGDGVVTIEFPDGGRFILSRQSATSQLWLAAESHGFHYNPDRSGNAWRDDKNGHELFAKLAELLSVKLGHEVEPLPI